MPNISFHQAKSFQSLSRCHNYESFTSYSREFRHVLKIFIAFELVTLERVDIFRVYEDTIVAVLLNLKCV